MRTVLAFLLDAYREATHTKIFQVLLILIGALLLVLLSIGFEPGPISTGVKETLENLRLRAKVQDVRELSRSGYMTRFEAGFVLDHPDSYLRALAHEKAEQLRHEPGNFLSGESIRIEGDGSAKRARLDFGSGDDKQEFIIDAGNVDAHLKTILEARLKRSGVQQAVVDVTGTQEVWTKTMRLEGSSSAFHLSKGGEISILFGVWKVRPAWDYGMAFLVFQLQKQIFDWVVCFFGVIFSLVVTAGMVPNLLRRGTAEFWLSKPVGRVPIILSKFLSGLIFVLPLGIALVGGMFLILSLRSGYWNFGFLASLGIFIVYFSVLHSLSMLFGLLTRSTIGAIFLTMTLWVLSWVAFLGRVVVHAMPVAEAPGWVVSTVDGISYLLPRTSESGQVAQYFMGKGLQIELADLYGTPITLMESFSMTESLVHSAAYVGLILILCSWLFQRRDF